ncbi:hypothetical protein [Mycoplasma sp. E35C]|uniref:hypothetical protein n=1 Tax=Mycoplasma sp. E35C TaxID=2801918 RepID=UPI001CA3CB5E|nr:hypothetical protein [Mycoplasma sp. E35C]QZX49423.1 hypothetical protein JJE79_01600 [Mycoplasma sp. E35C]
MPRKSTKSTKTKRTTSTKKTTTTRKRKTKSSNLESTGIVPLAEGYKITPNVLDKTTKKKRTTKPKINNVEPNLNDLVYGFDDDLTFGLPSIGLGDEINSVSNDLSSDANVKSNKKTGSIKNAPNKSSKSLSKSTQFWRLGFVANIGLETISSGIEDIYNLWKQNNRKTPTGYKEATDNSLFGVYKNKEGSFKYVNNWTDIYKNYVEADTKIDKLEQHHNYIKLFDK